jgi:twitching motility two-component system response regulator PilH
VIKSVEKNILVVDCSLTSLVLLEGLLSDRGYCVKTASSVNIAKRIMARWDPALILLDILPDTKNKIDFTKQLSRKNNKNGVPVIIVSSLDYKSMAAMSELLCVTDYVTKPVEQEILIRKVNAILTLPQF